MTHIQKKHADALKKAFSKEVMSKVPSQSKYLDWLKKDHIVNMMTSNRKDLNKEHPKEISNHDGSCFKMTERASGSDIPFLCRQLRQRHTGYTEPLASR